MHVFQDVLLLFQKYVQNTYSRNCSLLLEDFLDGWEKNHFSESKKIRIYCYYNNLFSHNLCLKEIKKSLIFLIAVLRLIYYECYKDSAERMSRYQPKIHLSWQRSVIRNQQFFIDFEKKHYYKIGGNNFFSEKNSLHLKVCLVWS